MARWDDPHSNWRTALSQKLPTVTVGGDPVAATLVPPLAPPWPVATRRAPDVYEWAMLAMTAGALVLSFATHRHVVTMERKQR